MGQQNSSLSNPSSAPQTSEVYYPRHSGNAIKVFNILRLWLPTEIVLVILDAARYWLLSREAWKGNATYRERDCGAPCLKSQPIRHGETHIREIIISIASHDQGWSSYPEDHGTFRNSWTWFDLGIERPPGREDLLKDQDIRLVTNVHADSKTLRQTVIFRSEQKLPWMQGLQAGDRISVIPMARFPGWTNNVEEVSIEIYSDPELS